MKSKKLSEVIIKTFKSNGFVLSEPDVLLDSDYIIERSGEKFRSSMLTFDREDGKTMCLRPDLTVASCISFLQKKTSSKIFYSGQAYRRSGGKGANFINDQLGIEILGSKNLIKDDFKVISTILNSAKKIKMKKIKIKVGDIGLFKSLINALEMPERWKLRLIRHFWRPDYFQDLLKRLEKNTDIDAVTFDADKKRFYEMKKFDQNKVIAGRSISEILKRFDKKIKDPRRPSRGRSISKIIKEVLKIKCPIDKAAYQLNKFFKRNRINLIVDQKYFPISKNKISKLNVVFSTAFGRQLEYYTGMVFKIDIKSRSKIINCCNGGRYDKLISDLGSNKQIPAVGAALNLNN